MAIERVCKQNGVVAGESLHRKHGANALAAVNMEQEKNGILTWERKGIKSSDSRSGKEMNHALGRERNHGGNLSTSKWKSPCC